MKNKFLQFKSKLRYLFNIKQKEVKKTGYNLVFDQSFDSIENVSNYWRFQQPWNWFHPSNLHEYHDKDLIDTKINDNLLHLFATKNPITINKSELPDWVQTDEMTETFSINNRIGIITSKHTWKYGIFEAELFLPNGKNLWPSFWLTGAETWPPEIDIFEAYSKESRNYEKKWLLKKRKNSAIEVNLHYGNVEENTKTEYSAIYYPIKNIDRFIKFTLHWERDFIKIYYDGHLVFFTKDKEILKWYDQEMMVILSNGTVNTDIDESSLMLIKSFKIYQKL